MEANMRQVMELLQWTEEQYCEHKYECGLVYLKVHLGNAGHPITGGEAGEMADDVRIMALSAAFWGWWKLHWMLRENDFLSEISAAYVAIFGSPSPGDGAGYDVKYNRGRYHLRAVYKNLHNPADLARALTPAGMVLDDSYSRDLISMIVKD
jgi:hypothetical protein